MTRDRSRGVDWPRIKALIVPFLWPRESLELRARVVIAFALLVAAKLVTVQVPFFFKAVIDRLSGPEGALLVLPLAALLAYGLARLTAAGFGELRDGIFAKVTERAGRRVSLKVFQHLFSLSLRYHLERRTGELARVTERGVQAIRFLLGVILFNVGPTLLEFGLVIGILLYKYPWPFALVTFITIAAYAVFTFVASEWRIAIRREMNTRDNEVSAQTVDSLLNYETVKAFGNEAFERDRLDGTLALYERAAIKSDTSLAALDFGQAAIIAIGVTVIMILAAQGVVAGRLTVGDVVLVNTFLLQLYQPLNFLGVVYRQVKQSLTDLESLIGLLELEPEIKDRPGAAVLAAGRRRGAVRERGFRLRPAPADPHQPQLHDPSRADAGRGRQLGRRQIDARPPAVPLLRDRRGQILIDGQDSATSPRNHCAPRSGWCLRTPCCSTTRSAPTSATAAPALPRRRSRPPRAWPRSTTSSRACRIATRPWSASAASSSPAAKSNGSRSRGWCSRTPRSWSSTRRPRRSTAAPSS